MSAYVPLFQTLLWIFLIIAMLIYLRPEVKLFREILSKRLEQGSAFKLGSMELGELRNEISIVRKDLNTVNNKVSDLFLTTMSPAMLDNLEKLSTGSFRPYKKSKGLVRELYHLRDIGYIDVKSIKETPDQDDNLSKYVAITETGKQFVALRKSIVKSREN